MIGDERIVSSKVVSRTIRVNDTNFGVEIRSYQIKATTPSPEPGREKG